jgi:hypothetical protein
MAVLGRAFGHTFLWSFGTVVLAFVAALFLPRKRIEPALGADPVRPFLDRRA